MPKATKAQRDKLAKIRAHYKQATESDQNNRRLAMEDMKFIHEPGAQWDQSVKSERGDRPAYEFNKLRVTVKRIVNDIRANRPQGKVRATEDSDREKAEVFEGLIRNVWNVSDGDTVIDQAAEYMVGAGMGAWRISVDYSDDSAFDQDVKIEAIRNPFCLYADPSAEDPMKRDARYWFLTTRISHEAFEEKYGKKAAKVDWEDNTEFEDDEDWADEDTVRLVEYWYREPVTKTIVLLSDGRTVEEADLAGISDPNLSVLKSREVQGYKIRNCIASGEAILEEGEWAGSQFPFVVMYGESMMLDGKHVWFGLPRFAKDAQKAYNYSRTYAIEAVSMAPQAKFWATPAMAEGHTEKWAEAHKKNYPFMLANADPMMGGRFPEAMPGANVPPAIINEIGISSEDIKGVTGIFDASLGARSNETSGVAISARQRQGEVAVYNYGDNLAKAIRRTWEILVDLIPRVYDTPRSLRILGADGGEDYVAINAPDPVTGQVLNDLSVGKYDVNVTIGPSFSSQRQEAAEVYMGLSQGNPQIMGVAGDLVFKSLDLPFADQIAERLKVLLPPPVQQMLSQGKAVPPEAQAAMQQASQAMQQVQMMGQQLQQAGQQMQQEKMQVEGQKAAVEADKAGIRTEIAKLQVQAAKIEAQYQKMVADLTKREAAIALKGIQVASDEEKRQVSEEANAAVEAIQKQADEFMRRAYEIVTAPQESQ